MNRKIAAACLLLAAPAAMAGYKASFPISIDTVNRTASGAFGSARNSADSMQMIGCSVYTYGSGSFQGSCFARDASGTYVTCSTTVPAMVDQMRSLPSDAYLRFTWDASNVCNFLYLTNVSYNEPK